MTLEERVRVLEEMLNDSLLQTQNALAVDRKHKLRTEVQDEGMLGLQMALCVSTIDPLKMGGIRIFNPILSDKDCPVEALPWAYPISPFPGFDDSGLTWVPPAGSRVAILMNNGDRNSIYYFGTIWTQHRGKDGSHMEQWGNYSNSDEYSCLWDFRRNGYTEPNPNDGDQVYPPWNTESYMGYDLENTQAFYNDPDRFKNITYPHIYGMKTNEKHSIKFDDGDPKCNKRWKRFEMRSSCNNIFMMKDDHLHPCGQWAYGNNGDLSFCHDDEDNPLETPCCEGEGSTPKSCSTIQCFGVNEGCTMPQSMTDSSVDQQTTLANPFYKRTEENTFYEGTPTPMQAKCELPQSGIQLQSISGHQFVMDDSVDQPTGVPTWDRKFDFGCNNLYKGKTFWGSATGHSVTLSDVEHAPGARGADNGIFLETALGTTLFLSDHTEGEDDTCDCPPNFAGNLRGLTAQTTSNHLFQMVDSHLHQCGETRKDGGVPKLEDQHNYDGYVMLRSGYGLQLLMKDKDIQTETNEQFIQILSPQTDNHERGPHMMVMQEAAEGPGLVMLRAGGAYYLTTYDDSIEFVGRDDENPSNKFCHVSSNYVIDVNDYYYNHNDLTLYFAEKYIFLLAGRDCPEPSNLEDEATRITEASNIATGLTQGPPEPNGPCIYPVICAASPWRCPLTGAMHFGVVEDADGTIHDSRSPRVFVVGKGPGTPSQPTSSQGDVPPNPNSYSSAGGNPGGNPDGTLPLLPDTAGQDGELAKPTIQDKGPPPQFGLGDLARLP